MYRLPFVLKRVHVLFMLFLFIYVNCCPTWFPYQVMFVSFNSNANGVTCWVGTGALPKQLSAPLIFTEVRSLIFCVMFCRWLFVLCPFSFSHCIVCPSIYCFWLPHCYFQTRYYALRKLVFRSTALGLSMKLVKHVPMRKSFAYNMRRISNTLFYYCVLHVNIYVEFTNLFVNEKRYITTNLTVQ